MINHHYLKKESNDDQLCNEEFNLFDKVVTMLLEKVEVEKEKQQDEEDEDMLVDDDEEEEGHDKTFGLDFDDEKQSKPKVMEPLFSPMRIHSFIKMKCRPINFAKHMTILPSPTYFYTKWKILILCVVFGREDMLQFILENNLIYLNDVVDCRLVPEKNPYIQRIETEQTKDGWLLNANTKVLNQSSFNAPRYKPYQVVDHGVFKIIVNKNKKTLLDMAMSSPDLHDHWAKFNLERDLTGANLIHLCVLYRKHDALKLIIKFLQNYENQMIKEMESNFTVLATEIKHLALILNVNRLQALASKLVPFQLIKKKMAGVISKLIGQDSCSWNLKRPLAEVYAGILIESYKMKLIDGKSMNISKVELGKLIDQLKKKQDDLGSHEELFDEGVEKISQYEAIYKTLYEWIDSSFVRLEKAEQIIQRANKETKTTLNNLIMKMKNLQTNNPFEETKKMFNIDLELKLKK